MYIELRHGGKKRAYQLNQSVLERASSWFFDALRQPPPAELDYELAASGTRKTNVTTRFELVYDSELDSEILRRMVRTKHRKRFGRGFPKIQTNQRLF